jgi:hypothetical protein
VKKCKKKKEARNLKYDDLDELQQVCVKDIIIKVGG